MWNWKNKNYLLCILPTTSIIMLVGLWGLVNHTLPNEMSFVEGREERLHFALPLTAKAEDINVLSVTQEPVSANIQVEENSLVTVKPKERGKAEISLSLFGVMPVKTVNATVLPTIELVPSGMAVGVTMDTDGIMVLGTGFVTGKNNQIFEPSKGLLKSGDLLKSASGVLLDCKETLMEIIETNGASPLQFVIEREGEEKNIEITPVYSSEDHCYKIGIWVRDSTQGIGTMTFYDKNTGKFGALGHGVYDIDTKKLMHIREGKITLSSIAEVKKGEKGVPGELIGAIQKDGTLGEITENTDVGLYGSISEQQKKTVDGKSLPIGLQHEVHEGPAKILSNIEGNAIEEYQVMIESVSKYSNHDSKGMVIKITDDKLIKKTGGIVQGMSGSPIIQDGKLIGAVTHVFVQDPTKGYGVFIENMLKEVYSEAS